LFSWLHSCIPHIRIIGPPSCRLDYNWVRYEYETV